MAFFVTDSQWLRTRDGRGVLAGSPLTHFTVTDAGVKILDALEQGSELPLGHESLTTRLLAQGAIHPVPSPTADSDLVTVVIPTYCTTEAHVKRLQNLVTSLHGLDIIVVDDASPIEISISGATIVRHDVNAGPGAARNTAMQSVKTSYVVFVDDDVNIDVSDISTLISVCVNGYAAVAAPRIASATSLGALGDYETHHSSLDLGTQPAVVRPTSRVSYVPSAVLACTTSTFRALDGFDESLRVGEDVDFVWRCVEAGNTCRYVPSVVCSHLPRSTWRDFARQRFSYGSSAAALDHRHPRAATPLRTHALLLAPPALFFSGFYLWAIAAVIACYGWFSLSLRSTRLSLKNRSYVVSVGLISTTKLLMLAVSRSWWPLAAVLSVVWSPLSLLFGLSVLLPPLIDVALKRPHHPTRFVLARVLDNFSYGLGVWSGAFRARSSGCLTPTITMRSGRLRSKG